MGPLSFQSSQCREGKGRGLEPLELLSQLWPLGLGGGKAVYSVWFDLSKFQIIFKDLEFPPRIQLPTEYLFLDSSLLDTSS